MHVIIDADPIVYRAGFAAETHNYHVVYETPEGELVDKYFAKDEESSAGAKKKAFAKEHEDYKVLSDDRVVDVEPVSFARQGVKITMDACIKDALRESGWDGKYQVTVLLSGPGNFREELATIKPYKGNRDPEHKPQHYQAIRDYLHQVWDARVIEGHEADDECSILAHMEIANGQQCVVCTIDKDLDQIPVPHYDYAKKVYYDIDDWDAQWMFQKQVLCGDATDNIQGMYKVGEAGAEKLLNKWREAWEELGGSSEDEVPDWDEYWWEKTTEAYKANMEKFPDKYPHFVVKDPEEGMAPIVVTISAEEAAIENARLVYMQTYRGELWTPPGQPAEETT